MQTWKLWSSLWNEKLLLFLFLFALFWYMLRVYIFFIQVRLNCVQKRWKKSVQLELYTAVEIETVAYALKSVVVLAWPVFFSLLLSLQSHFVYIQHSICDGCCIWTGDTWTNSNRIFMLYCSYDLLWSFLIYERINFIFTTNALSYYWWDLNE